MINKVYIAGPFFNSVQLKTIMRLEDLCTAHCSKHYSPRIHSGSADFTPEQRASYAAWNQVFNSNVTEIENTAGPSGCAMIAVLDYQLPEGQSLQLVSENGAELQEWTQNPVKIYIPDTGTVWEMGAAYMLGMQIYGFFPNGKPKAANLMLGHGVSGFYFGWDGLVEDFQDGDFTRYIHPEDAADIRMI